MIWGKQPKNRRYAEAEHAPQGLMNHTNRWTTLGSRLVAAPGSYGALEGGEVSVRSLGDLELA